MNALTTLDPLARLRPSQLSRSLDVDISVALNAEHNGKVPARSALPLASRSVLEQRVVSLRSFLAPATRNEVVRDLSRVFIALSAKADDGIDAKTRALVYADILRELPPFAIARACDDYCHGRVGDRKWAPTAAELKAVASAHAHPWKMEQERIERVLSAEVVEEVNYREKQRVLSHARDTMQQLRSAVPLGDPNKIDPSKVVDADEPQLSAAEKAEAWLKAAVANPKPLPKLSDALRSKLSLSDRKEDAA